MKSRNSNVWIALVAGSAIGALAYCFARTSKAKRLKRKVRYTLHRMADKAEYMLHEAKEKAVDAGKTVADKVADKVQDGADAVKEAGKKLD